MRSATTFEVGPTSACGASPCVLPAELFEGVLVGPVGSGEKLSLSRVLDGAYGSMVLFLCLNGTLEVGYGTLSRGDVLATHLDPDAAIDVRVAQSPLLGFAVCVDGARVLRDAEATLASFDVDLRALDAALVAAEGQTQTFGAPCDVTRAFSELEAACFAGSADGARRLRLVVLLGCVQEALLGVRRPARAGEAHARIARDAARYMREHFSEPLTIDVVAAACGTSPTVLKESFKEEYGLPVSEWLRRYRMLCAANLLVESKMSIADVSSAVGYANASKFARAFSECMGATPSVWRRRHAA